ncbi:hypothetical protein PY257_12515 [Ramlibacter sp. H39-3-26]|uniref:hypothetical protein n=1 Tax=Curvibacter soli TaxID=3031331 RepID=UPI0023DC1BF0|nr:hypothetical protein [Ramlibacter sp. H39-3-26]MDF1485991.1 hypothetical protein [Ramlibacter sp. H39-3-26]
MATPNYGYEKRQRELAKKKKQEEKRRSKADRKVGEPDSVQDANDVAPHPGAGAPPAPRPEG